MLRPTGKNLRNLNPVIVLASDELTERITATARSSRP